MTTKLFISDGHKGSTIESVIRRVFGRKAVFIASQDCHSSAGGCVGFPGTAGGFNILGTALTIESSEAVA